MTHKLHDVETVCEFALAGNATFTLRSAKTGTRYTFKMRKVDDAERWFVMVLTGPDNEGDYTYMGMVDGGVHGFMFKLTRASKMAEGSPPIAAMRFFAQQVLTQRRLPEGLEVYHEDRCGRCGRTLTVPESIERGIGPECATRL